MKFKVGDKVRLLKEKMNNDHCDKTIIKFKNEEIGVIEEFDDNEFVKNNIRIIFDNGYSDCWCHEDEIELVNKKPSKSELLKMPLGTIIKTDREIGKNVFVKVGEETFCNDYDDELDEEDIYDDLSIEFFGNRIMEIQEPTYRSIYTIDKEIREMTISEIEKELGYPIKVIRED